MSSSTRVRGIEVLLIVIALAVSAAWSIGVLPMHREEARIRQCQGNLRVATQAWYIYAADGDLFPAIFNKSPSGDMRLFAYRNQRPLPTDSPSPTADVWILLRYRNIESDKLVCPSSTDMPDPILDPTTAFDFASPDHLSYAYVYQYHPQRGALGGFSDPRLAMMADANPYLKGGAQDSAQVDRKSASRGNSRNHRPRSGENIAFVDGHTEFTQSPRLAARPNYSAYHPAQPPDNIYTTHADDEPDDPGNAPTWTRIQIGSKSDYCLVP